MSLCVHDKMRYTKQDGLLKFQTKKDDEKQKKLFLIY